MGDMTIFGPKKAPDPWPTMGHADTNFGVPSYSPTYTPYPVTFGGGSGPVGEPVKLIVAVVGLLVIAGSIYAGVVTQSWIVGLIAFAAGAGVYRLFEKFIETDLGEEVALVFNWTFALSAIETMIVLYNSPDIFTWGGFALCTAITAFAVIAARVAYLRLSKIEAVVKWTRIVVRSIFAMVLAGTALLILRAVW
jgi:hypothetical protein